MVITAHCEINQPQGTKGYAVPVFTMADEVGNVPLPVYSMVSVGLNGRYGPVAAGVVVDVGSGDTWVVEAGVLSIREDDIDSANAIREVSSLLQAC